MTLARRLQSLPRFWIYGLLFLVTSLPLFFPVPVPNEPDPSSVTFYKAVMDLKPGDRILLASDWTNSTRGESAGQFRALVRILARRGIKTAVYSTADPQAPQVARDLIAEVNAERRAANQPEWKRWDDWVNVGFFPQADSAITAIATNLRNAFNGKKDQSPTGRDVDVLKSPVLQGVKSIRDFKLLIVVTASKTSNLTVQRINQIPLAFMVTGVMGPESNVYYASGQLTGLVIGLKGVYDLETMMNGGVNVPGPDGKIVNKVANQPQIEGFPGETDRNVGNGSRYYPALHAALTLLIGLIVVGNIGMFLAKKEAKR